MQIVVNTRLLLHNRLEGMGRFAYETLKRVTQSNPNVHFVFLFDRPFHDSFIFSDNITPVVLSPQARHPFLYYLWFQYSVKSLLNRMKPDLFLSPDGFLSLGAKCKQLPVIHDINFYHYPKDVRWLTSRYYNYFFPRFAREAERIVTVSEFSKADIVKNFQIPHEKIDVVYNGASNFFKPVSADKKESAQKKFVSGKPYFIYVGSIHPRKNIPNLLKAFALLKRSEALPHKLLLAGPHYWGLKEVYQVIKSEGIEDEVVFSNRLSNEDLALAVGGAEALTFVPRYEGFGIPLVEAMACNIPIITSSVSSLPEVAGNAAILVNPDSPEEIKNAMLTLIKKEEVRSSLIANGIEQVKKFSWDKSAELLWISINRAVRN